MVIRTEPSGRYFSGCSEKHRTGRRTVKGETDREGKQSWEIKLRACLGVLPLFTTKNIPHRAGEIRAWVRDWGLMRQLEIERVHHKERERGKRKGTLRRAWYTPDDPPGTSKSYNFNICGIKSGQRVRSSSVSTLSYLSGVYPGNTEPEVGVQPEWDGILQDTVETHFQI